MYIYMYIIDNACGTNFHFVIINNEPQKALDKKSLSLDWMHYRI